MEEKIVYFAKPGKENTDEVLRIAGRRARELGIKNIVVASTTGATAVKAVDAFKGLRVVIVTLSFGAREANTQEFTQENRRLVESKAGTVLTAAHAFGGLSRSMGQSSIPGEPATYGVGDLVANTLRVFGQGMKVVCEIATMATDAGLVRTDEEVIAIAGTGSGGRGADTAVVIQPAPSHRFFDTKVKETLCKPRL
jgi:hypothetical protein